MIPFKMGLALFSNNLESPSHYDALYQDWLNLARSFREEFKHVKSFQMDRRTDEQRVVRNGELKRNANH